MGGYFFAYQLTFSQVSDAPSDYHAPVGLQQPTLNLLGSLLNSVTTALQRAAEEKSLILNKVQEDTRLELIFSVFSNVSLSLSVSVFTSLNYW